MQTLVVSLQRNLQALGARFLHNHLRANSEASAMLHAPCGAADMPGAARFAASLSPGLAAVSLMSCEFRDAAAFTAAFREASPGTPVVWGGIHPTISPEKCLAHADYVCVGEGEGTMLELARAACAGGRLDEVDNIAAMRGGEMVTNPLKPLIADLDSLPFCGHVPEGAWLFERGRSMRVGAAEYARYTDNRGRSYFIITSRGCPFACAYCCNNYLSKLYGGARVRRRSAGNVLEELTRAVAENPRIEFINIWDDCFVAAPEAYLEEFGRGYRENVRRPFIVRAIPTYITENKIRILKAAGMAWIGVGLQSGSDRICGEVYGRKSLSKDFLRAAEIIKRYDVGAVYDVIVDNPLETEEDVLMSAETLMRTPKPFVAAVFSLVQFEGTELTEKIARVAPARAEDGMDRDLMKPCTGVVNGLVRLAAYLPAKRVEKLLKLYRAAPDSVGFRARFAVAKVMSALVYEPVTFFELTRKMWGGSYIKTLMVLPRYVRAAGRLVLSRLHFGRQ